MSDVVVIDVDLGVDIREIIDESVRSITEQNKKQIDETIEVARITQRVAIEKQAAKASTNNKLQLIYTILLQSKISSDQLTQKIKPEYSTLSGFISKFKSFLKNEMNDSHTLVKEKDGYRLELRSNEETSI